MTRIATVRRSQLISTYGVGALVAAENASYMVKGLNSWVVPLEPTLREPRLERKLQLDGFHEPPSQARNHDIPATRFPTIYSCSTCHRLAKHAAFGDHETTKCIKCREELVPSRLIVVCKKGHIDDFPYLFWVHKGAAGTGAHTLSLETLGRSGGLDDLLVSCSCGKSRTLYGAFTKGALRGFSCSGWRPWLSEGERGCAEEPRTLQRGASNVWFSNTESSISIPPWSDASVGFVNQYWGFWKHVPDAALKPALEAKLTTMGSSHLAQEVYELIQLRKADSGTATTSEDMRREEYDALLRGKPETSREDQFVCTRTDVPQSFAPYFETVRRVERLREVRALVSFTRLYALDDQEQPAAAPLFTQDPGWRPAIEVRGEGVFLQLQTAHLQEWEERESVKARATLLTAQLAGTAADVGRLELTTPRSILLHTVAHMLLNQWALDSGYPASSLRERIYASATMAGFLIYTATSDSAGSLGGVVAQAQLERLDSGLRGALQRGRWCSADPLCIEADSQGTDNVNLAACHACVLLPEVSCERMNRFLDRALVVGTPEHPEMSYFHGLDL